MIGLFVLAVVVRVAIGGVLLSGGPEAFVLASDDGDAYDAAARWIALDQPLVMTARLAQKWALDTSVSNRWPQAYWLFLAAQYRLFGSAYASTVALQALLGGGGVLAAYALARRVLSQPAARVVGWAVALSAPGVLLSAGLYAESLYIPLLGGGLALVVAATQPGVRPRLSWLWLVLSGAAFALAEAARPVAMPVFVVTALWCVLPFGSRPVRARVGMLVGLCAGFLLAIAPFVAHDLAVSGRVTTFTVGGAEAFRDQRQDQLGQQLAALGADPYTNGALPAAVALATHPGLVLIGLPERAAVLFMGGWAPLGEPLLALLGPTGQRLRLGQWLLVAGGALWLIAAPARRKVGVLLGLAALAIVVPSLLLGLPLVRYRAAADPLFIVALVAGLAAMRDFIVTSQFRRALSVWARRRPAPPRAA